MSEPVQHQAQQYLQHVIARHEEAPSFEYQDQLELLLAVELAAFVVMWGPRKEGTAEQIFGLYLEALSGAPLDAIPGAGRRLRQTSRFFPTASEFCAAIEAVEDERSRAAARERPALPPATDVCRHCQTPFTYREFARPDGTTGERLYCDHEWAIAERSRAEARRLPPPAEPLADRLAAPPKRLAKLASLLSPALLAAGVPVPPEPSADAPAV